MYFRQIQLQKTRKKISKATNLKKVQQEFEHDDDPHWVEKNTGRECEAIFRWDRWRAKKRNSSRNSEKKPGLV